MRLELYVGATAVSLWVYLVFHLSIDGIHAALLRLFAYTLPLLRPFGHILEGIQSTWPLLAMITLLSNHLQQHKFTMLFSS